jgi:hypothetical protein
LFQEESKYLVSIGCWAKAEIETKEQIKVRIITRCWFVSFIILVFFFSGFHPTFRIGGERRFCC